MGTYPYDLNALPPGIPDSSSNSSSKTWIWGLVIFFVIVIIIVILYVTLSKPKNNNTNKTVQSVQPAALYALDNNLGAMSTKNDPNLFNAVDYYNRNVIDVLNEHVSWDTSTDKPYCTGDYYGPSCQYEAWNDEFYAFGSADDTNTMFTTYRPVNDMISRRECSNLSLSDLKSRGFVHENGHCSIINSDIILRNPVTYTTLADHTLFLKKSVHPVTNDCVYLSQNNQLPLRYYTERLDDENVTKICSGHVKRINFTPNYVSNDGMKMGIYSTKEFKASDVESMMKQKFKNVYIDIPKSKNYTITLPNNMRNVPLYVMY